MVFSFLVFGCFDLGLWWGLLFQSLMNWSGHTIAANTGFRFLVGGWFNSRSNSIISILKSFLQELEWLDSTYVTTSEPGHRFTSTFVWFLFYFVHHFFFPSPSACLAERYHLIYYWKRQWPIPIFRWIYHSNQFILTQSSFISIIKNQYLKG